MPTTTWDSFTGERGALASWRDSRLFAGSDVLIQTDGALTARPGFEVPFTWEWDEGTMASATIRAVGVGDGTGTEVTPRFEHLWFLVDESLYAWEGVTDGDPEFIGALQGVPTQRCVSVRQGSTVWIANPGEGIYRYRVTSTGPSLTRMDNVVPGSCFAVWQGVEICSGAASGATTPGAHRIYWSDLPGEWPAAPNFTAVGDEGSSITGLFVLRNQLFVAKDDGSWWVVTGTLSTSYDPEAQFYVRDVSRTAYPLAAQSAGHVNESFVTFSPSVGGLPIVFNGSQFTEVRHLVDATMNGADVIGGSGIGDVLMHRNGTAYFYQSGAWTKLTVPSGRCALYTRSTTNEQVFAWVTDPVTETQTPPKVFLMAADPLSAPSTTLATEGVQVPSTVTLSEVVGEGLLRPLHVHVDYTRIATTSPSESGLDVTVTPTRYPAYDGEAPPAPGTVARTATTSKVAGRFRYSASVGDLPPAWGFEVTLAPLAGVAVHRVSVEFSDEGQAVV